ncbi:hypothetical protein GNP93_12495 [Paenibacillus validus]|uniref:Uncharacterized protein n=1 Tax=Paenibacillus validus TaxID=44253 RepID=A0A7X2ZAS3_9BACL|nr:hypothetical protein [Paenibacillus validus]
MLDVKNAECKRVLERSDRLCADVEVSVEGEKSTYVALFSDSKDNDFDMVMLLKKDADSDIDWYDNDLHAAYVDVTESLFQDKHGETHWGARETFKEQVLSFGTVRADVRRMLEEAKKLKVEA